MNTPNASHRHSIQLRNFPYPYQAMLAICSDLDGTPSRAAYFELMRFLNTTQETSMGHGVNLEIGNSIHFRALPGQFSYWNTDDTGRAMVRACIKSGHIDCLHSYGEMIFTRSEVERAVNDLTKHGCKFDVWVDHGGAVTNFGSDIMAGHGDVLNHAAYHADLTLSLGIKFVWRGRVTSIIGQGVDPCFDGIFSLQHPLKSSKTILKEACKHILGKGNNSIYAMHASNKIMRRITLRDGSIVFEFIRSNPHWGGVSSCDQGQHIDNVLTKAMLNQLVKHKGVCILYTHLGKTGNSSLLFDHSGVNAFRTLADFYHNGKILVTTTKRLLNFQRVMSQVSYSTSSRNDEDGIELTLNTNNGCTGCNTSSLVESLSGMTFYVPSPEKTRLFVNNKQVTDLVNNGPDYSGRESVSIPWRGLEFPDL